MRRDLHQLELSTLAIMVSKGCIRTSDNDETGVHVLCLELCSLKLAKWEKNDGPTRGRWGNRFIPTEQGKEIAIAATSKLMTATIEGETN